jgi:hypothetical protein
MPYKNIDMTDYIDSYYGFNNYLKGYLPSKELVWPGEKGDLPLGDFLYRLTSGNASANESEANAFDRAGLGKHVVWDSNRSVFRLEKGTPLQSEHSGDEVFTTYGNSADRKRIAAWRAGQGEFRKLAENRVNYEGNAAKNERREERELRLARARQYRAAAAEEARLKRLGMNGDGFKVFLSEIKNAGTNADIWTMPAYRNLAGHNAAPPRMAVSFVLAQESESERPPQQYGQPAPQQYGQPAPQQYGQPAPQQYGQPAPQQQHHAGNFLPPMGRGDVPRSDGPKYDYLGASQQQRPRNQGGRGRG